jgi:molybdopterin molybdotransferase
LVEVSTSVGPHQTRRSNDYALRAALIAAGQPRVDRYHLRDMRHEIEHALWHIVAEYDVVLITGGVSKGKYDYLPKVLDDLGVKQRFQGVAQRPGKPFWFGLSPRHTPVFALPGNPAAAYVCLHRYALPALARMSGQAPKPLRTAVLAEKTIFRPKLVCFMPVRLIPGFGGELRATPMPLNTSGDFAGLIDTDGFVELPAEQDEFAAGTLIRVWEWA